MSWQDTSWCRRMVGLATLAAVAGAVGIGVPAATAARPKREPKASEATAGVSDAQVVAAMKKGIDFLLSTKQVDNWESGHKWEHTPETGGETALVLYSLLHAGHSLQDEPEYNAKLNWRSKDLSPVVEWVSKNKLDGVYAATYQAAALALTPKLKGETAASGPRMGLEEAKKYLLAAFGPDGGYDYTTPRDGTFKEKTSTGDGFIPIGDLSNAQCATLGVWALEDRGMEIPLYYWPRADKFWRMEQFPDGQWPYSAPENSAKHKARDSMSVAGLASLYITSSFVDTDLRTVPKPNPGIEKGHAWLNANFKPDSDDYYYLYSIERVGLASGYKFFGTVDWYQAVAANIVARQNADGSWDGKFFMHNTDTNIGTAYALVALARGRNPVVFNKLQYAGYWNARPRDDANVTDWMSKKFERPINWQIVNLQTKPEDWLDAPVLLITGSQDPKFTADDLAKLKAYVQAGGMIFSTADDGRADFTNAIRKYAAQIVDNKYEMRQLPLKHMIFTSELWADVKSPPQMLGMSNGVRDIWIHSTVDLGASWQLRRYAAQDHFIIPSNIYFYATGKGTLRSRLTPLTVAAAPGAPVHTIQLARVDHVGNADPEPGAWQRMVKLAQADFKTDLKVTTVAWKDLDPKTYKIAHMTGTTRFSLNADDTASLQAYLNGGGMLFVDSAGGSPDFTESFLELMKTVYPNNPPQPLPLDHPIIKGTMADGEDASEVEFRKYGNLKIGHRVAEPKLDAITVDGRIAVVFSPYDITSGFLGTSTWGIIGYAPDSAQALARNILLYSQDQKAAAPAAAAAVVEPKTVSVK